MDDGVRRVCSRAGTPRKIIIYGWTFAAERLRYQIQGGIH